MSTSLPRPATIIAAPGLCTMLILGCAGRGPAGSTSATSAAPPPPPLAAPADHPDYGVENVWMLSAGVARPIDLAAAAAPLTSDRVILSGSAPHGPHAFDTLATLGVKTVVSVDGAAPAAAAAAARGIRYIHIPIQYSGISQPDRLAIARALAEAEGPVYVHCHHGKHRGPAAAAIGMVSVGIMQPTDTIDWMKNAGTSSSYSGLYSCVASASALTAAQWRDAPALADLPEIAGVPGFAAAMARLERAFENLGECREAGWRSPADHPDLVPAAEAGLIADMLRAAMETPEARERPADHDTRLHQAWTHAVALEDAVVVGDRDAAELEYAAVKNSCRTCHEVYRNKP